MSRTKEAYLSEMERVGNKKPSERTRRESEWYEKQLAAEEAFLCETPIDRCAFCEGTHHPLDQCSTGIFVIPKEERAA